MALKKWMGLVLGALCAQAQAGREMPSQAPLLVIGASYGEGKTPFNNGVAPLGGTAVNFGSYLNLGQALTRMPMLPGHVINEAQGGATSFARQGCLPGAATCGPAGWDSYQTQLQKALARVALPPTFTQYKARYVVITTPNDCLHADASGVPQAQAQPCSPQQINQVADRLVAVGQEAVAKGLTPIFDVAPRYDQLDLPRFGTLYGLAWVIGEGDYNSLRALVRDRVKAEVPRAVVLDIWRDFKHIGDGVHPDRETVTRAAQLIAVELLRRDRVAR